MTVLVSDFCYLIPTAYEAVLRCGNCGAEAETATFTREGLPLDSPEAKDVFDHLFEEGWKFCEWVVPFSGHHHYSTYCPPGLPQIGGCTVTERTNTQMAEEWASRAASSSNKPWMEQLQ